MKGILSFSLTAVMAFSAYSQSLWTDTFETYNVGNLGTQGGWARDGGGTASWTQVATIDAAHGKSLKLASTAANEGVWHYHTTNWDSKSSANNIFVLEFDYYTGTGGAGGAGVVQIYDVDAGFESPFEIGWSQDDGYLYVADQVDGEILVDAVTTNTWYHIKAAYDTTTGEIKVKVGNNEIVSYFGTPGLAPQELDVLLAGITTAGFDNITTTATNVDPFLAVSDVAKKSIVSVFPNPATDVINVKSDSKIAQVSIYDASGKAVKTTTETTINVENLAKGTYVVSIKYADGSTESKKVIKD
ncbi:T9SS type A sorting domain-containing protein [Epilithonimonas sp. JDS]|uniref:T9SS type A sorting domain-containing protein n=1 Tax=Epilithonimonas sp. JDS TaxID=2902797 RepID=UPI001E46082A|nr:T9SS type A sorting domain-containing protein [Epilithonimonas sp. JDS]MCD9856595.1 T9SS type A sorting domain-containing protein [Epilithonimonas sp. JDS]